MLKLNLHIPRLVLLSLLLCLCAGCLSDAQEKRLFERQARTKYDQFCERVGGNVSQFSQVTNLTIGILQFDADGSLINTLEFSSLLGQVRRINASPRPFTRVAVVSLGWDHNFSDAQSEYADFFDGYFKAIKKDDIANRWLVLCISWPSGKAAFSQTLKSVLPSRTVATIVGAPLDLALLPTTVWASSGLADAIGNGELSDSLQYLINTGWDSLKYDGQIPVEKFQRPDIYLVGHSFGTRILTGALGLHPPFISKERGFNYQSSDLYNFRKNIKGAVYIQPALSVAEIEQIKDFPLFVTQSRHDHLNGGIFPIANVPYNLNSGPFSIYVQNAVSGSLYGAGISNHVAKYGVEFYTSVITFADTPPYSAVALAFSPFSAIPLEKAQPDPSILVDSLAQLPLTEIPVENIWTNAGVSSKGIFDFGRYFESAARVGAHGEKIKLDEVLTRLESNNFVQKVPFWPVYVDCSGTINGSVYSKHINYETSGWKNKAVNYSLGWLDPIGSHIDYEHPDIYRLIFDVLAGKCPNPDVGPHPEMRH